MSASIWIGLVTLLERKLQVEVVSLGNESRLTLHGVTTSFRKRNNMMYALIGREMGLPEVFVRNGPNALDTLGRLVTGEGGQAGSRDNEFTFESLKQASTCLMVSLWRMLCRIVESKCKYLIDGKHGNGLHVKHLMRR